MKVLMINVVCGIRSTGRICTDLATELEKQGHSVRVVSMPSMNLFDAQSDEYKESVLPNSCRKRLSVEMLSDFGWHKYVGLDGKTMGVDTFGASAPASKVIKEYGFTVENVVKEYNSL